MGEKDVLAAVAVEVGDVDPHSRLGDAVGVDCDAADIRFILERAVFLIDPQLIGIAVVGDVQIRPSIAVEIRGHDAESGAKRLRDPGF
jgi:hypothetical protein